MVKLTGEPYSNLRHSFSHDVTILMRQTKLVCAFAQCADSDQIAHAQSFAITFAIHSTMSSYQ